MSMQDLERFLILASHPNFGDIMKKYIIFFAILMLAASCTQNAPGSSQPTGLPDDSSQPTEPETQVEPEPVPVPPTIPPPEEVIIEPEPEPEPEPTITAEETTKVEDKITSATMGSQKMFVGTTIKTMQIGDKYVFGIGVKNINGQKGTFYLKANIDDAIAMIAGGANKVDYDESVLLSWLGGDFENARLIESSDYAIVPVVVDVKDMIGVNKPTQEGVYTFRITALSKDQDGEQAVYDKDGVTIAVRVAE